MKRNWRNKVRLAPLFIFLMFVMACTKDRAHSAHVDTYTCPMHPTVTAEAPGTCPVCGMDLVRKARPGESTEIGDDVAKLIKSPNERVLSSIGTVKGQYK